MGRRRCGRRVEVWPTRRRPPRRRNPCGRRRWRQSVRDAGGGGWSSIDRVAGIDADGDGSDCRLRSIGRRFDGLGAANRRRIAAGRGGVGGGGVGGDADRTAARGKRTGQNAWAADRARGPAGGPARRRVVARARGPGVRGQQRRVRRRMAGPARGVDHLDRLEPAPAPAGGGGTRRLGWAGRPGPVVAAGQPDHRHGRHRCEARPSARPTASGRRTSRANRAPSRRTARPGCRPGRAAR